MNLKQTSERHEVSQTAQWRKTNPPRASWTDSECEGLMCADKVMKYANLLFHPPAIHHSICPYVYLCVCTHSSPSSWCSCVDTCAVHVCVSVCVMIDLATETRGDAPLQTLPMHCL